MTRTKSKEPFDQVIFISDVHFGKGNIEKLQIMKDYFDNFFIPFVKQQKKSHNPCIVIAGDYFDNRQNIDINVLNVAIDVMKDMAKECQVYVVIGNHDIYKKCETDITSLKPFDDVDGVMLIYDKYELTLKDDKGIQDKFLSLMPVSYVYVQKLFYHLQQYQD